MTTYDFGRDLRATTWMRPGHESPLGVDARYAAGIDDEPALTRWCDAHGVETVRIDRPLTFRIAKGTAQTNATLRIDDGVVKLGPPDQSEMVAEAARVRAEIEKIVASLGAPITVPSMVVQVADWEAMKAEVADLKVDREDLARQLQSARAERDQFSAALIEAQRVIAGLRGVVEPEERGAGLLTLHGGVTGRHGR